MITEADMRDAVAKMKEHGVPHPYFVLLPHDLGKRTLEIALEDGLQVERVPSEEVEGYDELAGMQVKIDGRWVRLFMQNLLPE